MAQVFELREIPEPQIIMACYPKGNLIDTPICDEAKRISGFGQVLEALSHLHEKGVVHRDLKPENLLIELEPFFKVVITDFGLASIANDNDALHTFCGTPKYTAPEVFPGVSTGRHGTPADVWSLGILGIEWIYNFPEPPALPVEKISPDEVYKWNISRTEKWCRMLEDEDEGGDLLIGILLHMVKFSVKIRWPAKKCLVQGLHTGLFKRRIADGLIICAHQREDLEGTTGTPAAPPLTRQSQQESGIDYNVTIIQGKLWDDAA